MSFITKLIFKSDFLREWHLAIGVHPQEFYNNDPEVKTMYEILCTNLELR
jgi:hypothetical protein